MSGARAGIPVVAVSRLANYIAKLFGREKAFARLGVRGEVSNLKPQANGNLYFDLKDRDALLNCVAYSEAAASFPAFANGDEVVAYGGVQTFVRSSRYQLRVFDVAAEGETGALHQRYEALKARLTAEGVFASERKRPLPRFPFRVALVTSRSADGARDFITQATARAPHVEIVIETTPVQGENAAPEIVRAIGRAAALDVDLLVIARGGGSFEDLFAFSDERVVRALAASRIPTVSAIGHEADAPLVDFVADRRAATPSEAAQTVLPRRSDLLALLAERGRTIGRDVERMLGARRQRTDIEGRRLSAVARERLRRLADPLVAFERRLAAAAPASRLAQRRGRFEAARDLLGRSVPALLRRRQQTLATYAARLERVDPPQRIARAAFDAAALSDRLDVAMRRRLERGGARLGTVDAALRGHNPDAILQRGYAIVEAEDGALLTDAERVPAGTRIRARLAHGILTARVEREGTNGGRQIDLF